MSPFRLFDDEMVQLIRWHVAQGESDRTLADALGCTVPTIYQIRTRRIYREVPEPPWSADWLLNHAEDIDAPVFAAEHERRWAARMAHRSRAWMDRAVAGGLP